MAEGNIEQSKNKNKDTEGNKDTSQKPSSMLYYYSKDLFDIEDMPPMDVNELSRLYHNKAYINPDAMVSFSVDALNDMLRTTFIISPDKIKETSDKIMQNIHTLVNLKSKEDSAGEMDFSQDDTDEILKPLDPTERDDAKVAVGISLGKIYSQL